MTHYIPFLKLKSNEIGAILEFEKKKSEKITPFFDIPRPSKHNETNVLKRIAIGKKEITKLGSREFYLDNYDLDDTLKLRGIDQYKFILDNFSGSNFIPVTGLNRDPIHNKTAIQYSAAGICKIAIRLTQEDIESYKLTKPQLAKLWAEIVDGGISTIHIILDLRILDDIAYAEQCVCKFLQNFKQDFETQLIIIAGSSIPAIITALVTTNTTCSVDRKEWLLWKRLKSQIDYSLIGLINFGDYGIVSPDYSDEELDDWLIQSVAAPKVFYTYTDKFFITRGGAFKKHPDGYKQYFSIADVIVAQSFFRDINYSFGEKYIHDRSSLSAKRPAKGGSPSSWLKATLASHITFIVDSL
jgi:hypothetical protein